MSSNLEKKIETMHVGENLKETASALVSDVKEIANDAKEAAGDSLDQARKSAKEVLQKVEKKLS